MPHHHETKNINMANTIIRVDITYSIYAIPHSLPTIEKPDKIMIAIHNTICSLPTCMSNIITQLLHDMFGIEAFLLRTHTSNALANNLLMPLATKVDSEGFQMISQYILTRFGGAQNLTRVSHHECTRSPIT